MDPERLPSLPSAPAGEQPIVNKATPPPNKPRLRKLLVGTLFGIVIFILLLVIGTAALATYTDTPIPFLSPEQRAQISSLLYRIPGTPKTPQQILLRATQAQKNIQQYHGTASFNAEVSSPTIDAATLDIVATGVTDISDRGNIIAEITTDIGIAFAGTSYEIAGTIRKPTSDIYARINSVSESIIRIVKSFDATAEKPDEDIAEIMNNLSVVFENWVLFETDTSIESEAKEAVNNSKENKTLDEIIAENVRKLLLGDTVLPHVTLIGTEQLNEHDAYHLQVKPTKDMIKQLTLDFYRENNDEPLTEKQLSQLDTSLDAIKNIQIDIWIDTTNHYTRKISIVSSVSLADQLATYTAPTPLLSADIEITDPPEQVMPISPLSAILGGAAQYAADLNINTALVVSFDKFNEPVTISTPDTSMSAGEYFTQLQQAFKTQKEIQSEAEQQQIDDDLYDLGAALRQYHTRNNAYPQELSSVATTSANLLPERLDTYTYLTDASGSDYILYTPHPDDSQSIRIYYGIESGYTYPHSITARAVQEMRRRTPQPTPATASDSAQFNVQQIIEDPSLLFSL